MKQSAKQCIKEKGNKTQLCSERYKNPVGWADEHMGYYNTAPCTKALRGYGSHHRDNKVLKRPGSVSEKYLI